MLNRIVSSIIFATLLALGFVFVSPAQAQMIEEVQQAEGAPALLKNIAVALAGSNL